MERCVVESVLKIENKRFTFNFENLLSVALQTQESFKKYPTDSGHNFENHAFLTLMNVFMLLETTSVKCLDELLCASILHDRNRIFLGHIPVEVLHRQIMRKSGLDVNFQDRVMEIISTHSEMEQKEPFKKEKEILFLADKMEYANWNRAESALKTMPKWMVNWYKEKWEVKITKVEEKIHGYRHIYPTFVNMFDTSLRRSRQKLGGEL